MIWLGLALMAAAAGALAGCAITRWWSIILGAIIPWFGLLAWLLYREYFVPSQGGGASLWLVAQLLAGTFVAAIGGLAAAGVYWARRKT